MRGTIIFLFIFVFFFQAEDGIRDGHVTGVQTCALPICGPAPYATARARATCGSSPSVRRSEERRVGKECRSRRAAWPERRGKRRGGRRQRVRSKRLVEGRGGT